MKSVSVHILSLFSVAFLMSIGLTPVGADHQTVADYCEAEFGAGNSIEFQDCASEILGDFRSINDLYNETQTVADYCEAEFGESNSIEFQNCVNEIVGYRSINDVYDHEAAPQEQGDGGGSGSSGGDRKTLSDIESAESPPAPDYVDHTVAVTGAMNFQPVTLAGIGVPAIIEQGVVSATDVWGNVPAGTRVCFVGHGGGVMFLDAAAMPRAHSWLQHFILGGDTCVDLPGAGTVILVERGGSAPVAPPIEALPVSDCQIKLTETLRLRDEPGGEIIALVWLYSEVPVYDIDGHWYLVEFEGQIGYISRYHHKVLWGASC